MIKKIEDIYFELMESSEEASVAELSMKLIETLLRELCNEGKGLLSGVEDSFDRKRIIALYSKMNGNYCSYLDNYQAGLDQKVHSLEEDLREMKQNVDVLEEKKQRFENQLLQFKEDTKNQEFLLNETKLRKQKERLDTVWEKEKELKEEELRVLGADGKAIENCKERQKEYQKQKEEAKEEAEYQEMVSNILDQIFVRETENNIVSNMEDVMQQLYAQDAQGKKGFLDERIKSTYANIQEMITSYNLAAQKDAQLQDRYELYRKNWGEDSNFMMKLNELGMEDDHKLNTYMDGLRNEIDAQMKRYEDILGAVVLQREKERDAVEQRQNKR